jgi:hypothetical protein
MFCTPPPPTPAPRGGGFAHHTAAPLLPPPIHPRIDRLHRHAMLERELARRRPAHVRVEYPRPRLFREAFRPHDNARGLCWRVRRRLRLRCIHSASLSLHGLGRIDPGLFSPSASQRAEFLRRSVGLDAPLSPYHSHALRSASWSAPLRGACATPSRVSLETGGGAVFGSDVSIPPV